MTTNAKPFLPGVLGWIAEDISENVAVKLATSCGGREVYIPKVIASNTRLAQIMGHKDAKALLSLLGHGTLLVPHGSFGGQIRRTEKLHERIRDLRTQGRTNSQIAAEVDVHIRTVERVFEDKPDPRQSQLPL
jgi:DNA-binding NarL/FixJ family response regulator